MGDNAVMIADDGQSLNSSGFNGSTQVSLCNACEVVPEKPLTPVPRIGLHKVLDFAGRDALETVRRPAMFPANFETRHRRLPATAPTLGQRLLHG